jgi:steroid delta-isomerase-like uncharacterized protein
MLGGDAHQRGGIMEPLEVAAGYFDAWNRRDPEAIAASFAPDGTYSDPGVPDGLGPAATGHYAGGLFAAFSDLAFEVEWAGECGGETVAAQWVMTGTNDGPFQGLPPSGRGVRLPGADVIVVEGERVRSVTGYFDTAAVPRQLGLQVVVQPTTIGPFSFGTGTYVQRSGAQPGAVSLTVLEARTAEEREEVADRSRDTALEMLAMPGFISWLGIVVGDRMYTVTAWEDADGPGRLRESPAHSAAMERFFASPGIARGGQTGVWTAQRLNGMWTRCDACGEMRQAADGRCPACGAQVAPPAYW